MNYFLVARQKASLLKIRTLAQTASCPVVFHDLRCICVLGVCRLLDFFQHGGPTAQEMEVEVEAEVVVEVEVGMEVVGNRRREVL